MNTTGRWLVLIGVLLVGALFAIANSNLLRDPPIVSALFGNWDFVKRSSKTKVSIFA